MGKHMPLSKFSSDEMNDIMIHLCIFVRNVQRELTNAVVPDIIR